MRAKAVLVGKVTVVVTNVPGWFLLSRERTVTIKRADFVGLTVEEAVARVREMRRWNIISICVLNGKAISLGEADQAVLRPGDTLLLVDP